MLDEITEFKLKVRLYYHILGTAAASFFSALQFTRGENITATISLLGSLYLGTVIYLIVHKRTYLWNGRAFLFFFPVTILSIIHLHPEFGIYWAYVGISSFFVVMDLREATVGSILFTLGVFVLASPHYPDYVLYRIYATLILVGLFSFSLLFLVERFYVKLNNIATIDSLTNTLNRHTFNTSIERILNEFTRYQTPATMVLLDIDHFKRINDTFGHPVGDKVLQELTRIIQQRIRTTDQLFRYGGEEFALLLTQTKIDTAFPLAEELRTLIEGHDFQIGQSITISSGISEAQTNDTMSTWLKRCDSALYKAKESGRNQVVWLEDKFIQQANG